MWYHSGEFSTQPLKARELEIKKLNEAIEVYQDGFEIASMKRIIENLSTIPDDNIAVCAVCHAVYDSRYSYSVCSDSCFRDKFM